MRKIAISKIAAGLGIVGLAFCLTGGSGIAKPQNGHPGGGHPGGGGAHFGGGGAHFGGAHFGGAHFAPHISSHVGHIGGSSFHAHTFAHTHALTHHATPLAHPLAGSHATTFAHHFTGGADPHSFAAHRSFAGDPAFHHFWGHGWHPFYHVGWIGPLFWPYAYGDFFYCSLWPWSYCYADPFWAYGYGDIYESIFWPYDYAEYVEGPRAPQRMASLTQGMAQSCTNEAAEVTGWPIDQIQDAVQPSPQQNALLDDLGNAIVKASDDIKSHCPTTVAFTPTDRLAQMRQRLQAMVDAVNLIEPPLTKFYDSLSDEQKARFNDIAPPQPPQPPQRPSAQARQGQPAAAQGEPSLQAQCNANVMAWPTDRIDSTVHPSEAQRAKLDGLQAALAQAADTIKAACPSELPATPPARLAAAGKRMHAMLSAVETVQPALADFYNSLSDEQKARFNTMGKQLFAANQ